MVGRAPSIPIEYEKFQDTSFSEAKKQLIFGKIWFLPRKSAKKICGLFVCFCECPVLRNEIAMYGRKCCIYFYLFSAKTNVCVKFVFRGAFILMLSVRKLGIVDEHWMLGTSVPNALQSLSKHSGYHQTKSTTSSH